MLAPAGPDLITLCLKSTLPSRAGCAALLLRVPLWAHHQRSGRSPGGRHRRLPEQFLVKVRVALVGQCCLGVTGTEGGLLRLVWAVFQGRAPTAAGGPEHMSGAARPSHAGPGRSRPYHTVLEEHIAKQGRLRRSASEGPPVGAPSAQQGVPGWRHRRPRKQSVVICKGTFVMITVKRSHARRWVFCASFG